METTKNENYENLKKQDLIEIIKKLEQKEIIRENYLDRIIERFKQQIEEKTLNEEKWKNKHASLQKYAIELDKKNDKLEDEILELKKEIKKTKENIGRKKLDIDENEILVDRMRNMKIKDIAKKYKCSVGKINNIIHSEHIESILKYYNENKEIKEEVLKTIDR
ncbi:hypothetical protein AN642_00730 [Epulopiscium sp. SCG-B10WGA-EpuloA2]|nr:hypothetical protein AN642_00730 [Epulopiscium sp. SCG-B10WGA-EpuloA2]